MMVKVDLYGATEQGFNKNIKAVENAIERAPAQYVSNLVDTKHILIALRDSARWVR